MRISIQEHILIFFSNKILEIKDLFLFQLGQLMHNYKSNKLPYIFDQTFNRNHLFHNYPTNERISFTVM